MPRMVEKHVHCLVIFILMGPLVLQIHLQIQEMNLSMSMEDNQVPMSFFDITHKTKDGAYPNNTTTEEFINIAKSKIEENVAKSISSKPRVEMDNEVFNELMYDKDKTNQRPIGYGFGVKRNDVMGVHALLQKRGVTFDINNNGDQNLKVEFAKHKKQTVDLVRRLTSHMSSLLSAVQSGRATPEMLDATVTALRSINEQKFPTKLAMKGTNWTIKT